MRSLIIGSPVNGLGGLTSMSRSLALMSSSFCGEAATHQPFPVPEEGSPGNEVIVIFSMSSSDRKGQTDGLDGTKQIYCPENRTCICIGVARARDGRMKSLNFD